jgi:hypothetical protein
MALTKKEQAERTDLLRELRLARALCWPGYTEPARIEPPAMLSQPPTLGFLFNPAPVVPLVYGSEVERAVYPAYSRATGHGEGHDPARNGRQGPRSLYPTRLDALLALRLEATRRVAAVLAEVDLEIEKERQRAAGGEG